MVSTFTLNIVLSFYHGVAGQLSYSGLVNFHRFQVYGNLSSNLRCTRIFVSGRANIFPRGKPFFYESVFITSALLLVMLLGLPHETCFIIGR